MQKLRVQLGQPIDDGNYPSRLVFADYAEGFGTFLRVDNEEEDVFTLQRQVPHIQKENARRRRAGNT